MKKLIALISTVSVVAAMSMTSFAAATVSVSEDITNNGDGTFTTATEATANNAQTTIVAVTGTEITTNSIQYIDQASDKNFTFALKDSFDNVTEATTLNVYMGGDNMADGKVNAGTITFAPQVTKYTVKFMNGTAQISSTEYEENAVIAKPATDPTKEADATNTYAFAGWYVEGDAEQTIVTFGETAPTATANVTYVAKFNATPIAANNITVSGTVIGNEGTSAATLVISDGVSDYDITIAADGTFTIEVPELSAGAYTLGASKTGYLGYTKANISTTSSGVAVTIKAGDANADGSINLTDLLALLDNYNTDATTIECDYDESGSINLQDLLVLLNNYNTSAITE